MEWLLLLGVPVTRIAFQLVIFLALALACFGQQEGKLPVQTSGSTNHQVSLIEFADFQCPFCANQAADLRKLKAEYRDSLTVVFKNFPLPFHKQSKSAHLAAIAAGEQGKFWEMHDLIYGHPQNLSPEDFEHYAVELGLDKEQFRNSLVDPRLSDVIEKDIAEGKALGVNATPTFVVNGHRLVGRQSYARLKQIVETELLGEPWQTTERVRVNIDSAPSLGSVSAPVTVVEFSDFQCPFCARAAIPLQRLLVANQGRVRFVFKNFPLDIHADSRLAHMAALSAGEQGKFWEMHDLIFAHQHSLKRSDLLSFATQLNLDMVRFQKDIESPQLKARIDDDISEGQRLGVVSTPTFIVNGDAFSGFSTQQLEAKIDSQASRVQEQTAALRTDIPKLNLSLGPEDAPTKIRWYVDLTSPLTAKSAIVLQHFLAAHSGRVQIEFKNFPLRAHSSAMLVHEFALAAAAQGKFWPMESLLLADSKPKDREELTNLAAQAQLDQDKLWAEVDGHKYAPIILRDLAEANRDGISGTPTFVIGNQKLDGVNGLDTLP
jgi:protein-disulfide isomerase